MQDSIDNDDFEIATILNTIGDRLFCLSFLIISRNKVYM